MTWRSVAAGVAAEVFVICVLSALHHAHAWGNKDLPSFTYFALTYSAFVFVTVVVSVIERLR